MRVELLDDSPKYACAIGEALEILERVQMHDGEFGYSSQVFKDTLSWPSMGKADGFKLVIRPAKEGVVVNGQPVAHQYVEMYVIRKYFSWRKKTISWDPDETPIARLHFE